MAVTYFGDGASSQGDVHEAMNFAAVMKAPVVFFIQNNGWAISVPTERQVAGGSVAARAAGYGIPSLQIDGDDVAAVDEATRRAFAHARAGNGPVVIEAMTYRRGPHSTSDDPGRYRSLDEERDGAGIDPLDRLRQRLLADGIADEAFFAEALAAAKAEEEQIRTGIQALGSRPGTEMFRLRSSRKPPLPCRPRPPTGARSPNMSNSMLESDAVAESPASTTVMSMQQALNRALDEVLADNPRTLIFGEDCGRLGGVFRITDGLQAKHGPQRVFDTPLAETGILGMSVGLAMAGFHPIPEVQFDGFTFYPAINQIVCQIARMNYRSRGTMPMPITLRVPSFGGIRAPEHHGESLEALFAHVPGPEGGLGPDPVIFMEPKSRYWQKGEVDLAHADAAGGTPEGAKVMREGRHLTLVAWGAMVSRCLQVAELAAEDGIDVEVLDLRWLKPIDAGALAASVRKTRRAVVVHEAPLTSGLGAEVAQLITQSCFDTLRAPVERVTGFDVPYPSGDLEDEYIPNIDRILFGIQRVLEYKRG